MTKRERISKMPVRMLADMLMNFGVEQCVVSPGSRNAPIILEFSRNGFRMHTVIDERTAGFVALGMAKATCRPVAVVCTSGTAVLNLAPALAEAYYSQIPMIAITADRPEADIDQRLGQTIRQNEALAAVVRCSVSLSECMSEREVADKINKALITCKTDEPGPVQINIHLSMPLTVTGEYPEYENFNYIKVAKQDGHPSVNIAPAGLHGRVLILLGSQMTTNFEVNYVNNIVERLKKRRNVRVLAEIQANIPSADRLALYTGAGAALPVPDLAVVLGGTFVDPRILPWLARHKVPVASAGLDSMPVARGLNVTYYYRGADSDLLAIIDAHLSDFPSKKRYNIRPSQPDAMRGSLRDPDVEKILAKLPPYACVFIANGMSIRQAQFTGRHDLHVYANRGVSGIDGCTSTAIGIAKMLRGDFFLITGDMGAFYDIGALAVEHIPAGFHMVVIDNGGGGIFRNVATTASLPHDELERFFLAPPKPVLADFARNCGFEYVSVSSDELTDGVLAEFILHRGPIVLNIKQI